MSLADRPDTSKPERVRPTANPLTDHWKAYLPGSSSPTQLLMYLLAFHAALMGRLLPLSHTPPPMRFPSSFRFLSWPRRKLEFSQSFRFLLGNLCVVFRVWSDGCLPSSVRDYNQAETLVEGMVGATGHQHRLTGAWSPALSRR